MSNKTMTRSEMRDATADLIACQTAVQTLLWAHDPSYPTDQPVEPGTCPRCSVMVGRPVTWPCPPVEMIAEALTA